MSVCVCLCVSVSVCLSRLFMYLHISLLIPMKLNKHVANSSIEIKINFSISRVPDKTESGYDFLQKQSQSYTRTKLLLHELVFSAFNAKHSSCSEVYVECLIVFL